MPIRKERRRQIANSHERNTKLRKLDADTRLFPGGPVSARCTLVRMENLPVLEFAAVAGDKDAEGTCMQVLNLILQYDSYHPGDPTSYLCLSCATQMRTETLGAVALMTSLRGNYTLGIGICKRCSCSSAQVILDNFLAYASKIWPGVHIVGRYGINHDRR